MRKMICLFLVAFAVCTMLNVTIYANEIEDLCETRGLVIPCLYTPGCTGEIVERTVRSETVWEEQDGCTNNAMTHYHGHYYIFTYKVCTKCNIERLFEQETITVCPYE